MHPEVLKNLVRFKEALRDELRLHKGQDRAPERSYQVLVNCRTGDMRFLEKIGASSSLPTPAQETLDWWNARLVVTVKSGKVLFTLFNDHEKAHQRAALAQLAWRILCETLTVLNCKAKEMNAATSQGTLPEEAVLHNLSSIDLSKPGEAIEELPGWSGALDRMAAEARLEGHVPGTYLLREADEVTRAAIPLVEAHPGSWLHFYVLTAVTEDRRMIDVLLLQTHQGWTVHQDNPDLGDSAYAFYSSPRALLLSLGPIARHPMRSLAA